MGTDPHQPSGAQLTIIYSPHRKSHSPPSHPGVTLLRNVPSQSNTWKEYSRQRNQHMQIDGGKRDLSTQKGPGMLGEREKPKVQEKRRNNWWWQDGIGSSWGSTGERLYTVVRQEGQTQARLNQVTRNDDHHYIARKWKRVGNLSGEWAMMGAVCWNVNSK